MNSGGKPILTGQRPAAMLVFTAIAVIILGLVFQLIGLVLAGIFFDVRLFDLLERMADVDSSILGALKFLQIVAALGTFVFSSFLLSRIYTGSWLGFFPFGRSVNVRAMVILLLIVVAALPAVNFLTDLNTRFRIPLDRVEDYFRSLEEQTESLMMALIRAETLGTLLVNFLMIALIPAVGEELVFRGLIQKHFRDIFRNPHVAVLLASVIFSLAHFQVYSFLPRFFLGIILGYMLVYGKSLWYPMAAHLVNNTMGVLFYFFYNKGTVPGSVEEIGTVEVLPYTALVSFVVVAALFLAWIRIAGSDGSPGRNFAGKGSRM